MPHDDMPLVMAEEFRRSGDLRTPAVIEARLLMSPVFLAPILLQERLKNQVQVRVRLSQKDPRIDLQPSKASITAEV
eukprot:1275572-Amphidinium_carterae.2